MTILVECVMFIPSKNSRALFPMFLLEMAESFESSWSFSGVKLHGGSDCLHIYMQLKLMKLLIPQRHFNSKWRAMTNL